jgi:hypothetical protein
MTWIFATFLLSILFNVVQFFYSLEEIVRVVTSIEPRFWGIFAVGFLGQMIKGILGLGYGVTATSSTTFGSVSG